VQASFSDVNRVEQEKEKLINEARRGITARDQRELEEYYRRLAAVRD
jgi:hypothetical protein